jgi:hypothetical protein
VNLRKKSYHIFNEPYSKEEYENRMKDLYPDSVSKIEATRQKVEEFAKDFPQKYMHGLRTLMSSGDYITDTKNARNCFVGFNIEDSRYCSFVTGKLTDAYDFVNFGADSSLMYEVLQGGDNSSNLKMSHWTISNCQNVEYGLFLDNCKDCFGCVGLKSKQYCILNTQYTKEEYREKRKEIMGAMETTPYIDAIGLTYKYGEFFPIEQSPFAYNESTAQEFFPLTKEEALTKGYTWREPEKRNYQPTILAKNIPETIAETEDAIKGEILGCEHAGNCSHSCTEAFKIVPEELSFYRRMHLPVPHLCPNCRHHRRLSYRNPLKLWHRKCMSGGCSNEFETSYAPERLDIIFCESCYQKEVS